MKYKQAKQPINVRRAVPKVEKTPKGVALLCPFCVPPHPLMPDQEARCGTIIEVNAVQMIVPVRTIRQKNLVCIKCGKGAEGGEMVRFNNGYVHLKECSPETKLITEPPKFDIVAQIVYKMPTKIRAMIEKRTGAAKQVDEIDAQGKPTGKTLGYFFYKA